MEPKKETWGKWVLCQLILLVGGIWGWAYLLSQDQWPGWVRTAIGFTCAIYFFILVAYMVGTIALWIEQDKK